MSDLDFGFAYLIGNTRFGRFAGANVRGFISQTRRVFKTDVDYPAYSARMIRDRAIAAMFEAGAWLHAAETDPELCASERSEWRLNATVLQEYAADMETEAKIWDRRRAWEDDTEG